MIGTTLNHYKILDQLGAGGMGEVYLAEDLKLERKVALKVLPEEFASDADRLSRFTREAKALAAMSHPGIVTIFSVEEAEGGVHFLTMERVEGKTLEDLVPPDGLTHKGFLELAIPVAEAVAAAHAKGITHRDLKPANVMVTAEGRVKVLDFGLASSMQAAGDEGTEVATATMTATHGKIVGTVAYMSPEQAEGKPVDPRSDIFSLGILLFEMATGQRPFKGETPISVLSEILRSDPPSVLDLKPELPRQLSRILSRCLKKDPTKRFLSASDLHSELVELQREGAAPAEITRPPAWRRVAAVVAILIVALLGGQWLIGRFSDSGPSTGGETAVSEQRGRVMIAVLPFENLGPSEDEYFAAGITEEITSRLAMIRGLGVISRDSAILYDKTEKPIAEIGQELGIDYLLRGSVRWSSAAGEGSRVRITPRLISVKDDTHLWAATFDRQFDDIFAIQTEIAVRVEEQLDLAVFSPEKIDNPVRPTENLDAYQEYLRALSVRTPYGTEGRCEGYLQRIPHLERAVELDPEFAVAWAELAAAQSSYATHCSDRSDERIAEVNRALDRAIELDSTSLQVLLAQARYAMQIERDYDRAYELLDGADQNQGGDSSLAQTKATVLRRQGRWPEAIHEFKRAFELDPRNSQTAMQIGSAYMYARDYEQAIEYFDRAITLSPTGEVSFARKAWTWWLWKGDLLESEATLAVYPGAANDLIEWAWFWQLVYDEKYQEALDRLAGYSADWINTEMEYQPKALLEAQAHALAGQHESARKSYSAARAMIEAELQDSPDNAKLHRALSLTYAGLGRKEEALRHATLAVASSPIEEHPYFGETNVRNLALVYTLVGELDSGIETLGNLLSLPSLISVPMVRLDPGWQGLLVHPEFQGLLEAHDSPAMRGPLATDTTSPA